MLHKPVGFVTTRRDPQARPTVYDLLPADLPFLSAVGRLDLDSSGLLLFTNDTQLAAGLTDPDAHVPKVYAVRLDAPIGVEEAARLAAGVLVRGRKTRPARVELRGKPPSAHAFVTLGGTQPSVRRMFMTLGRTVLELQRCGSGAALGNLGVGKARYATDECRPPAVRPRARELERRS